MYFTGVSSLSHLQIKSCGVCCRSVFKPVESFPLAGIDCRLDRKRRYDKKIISEWLLLVKIYTTKQLHFLVRDSAWDPPSPAILRSVWCYSLPKFRDNLSVPPLVVKVSSGISEPLKMEPIGCSVTSWGITDSRLRNISEEGRSHPLCSGSLKSSEKLYVNWWK
jgi:hypothetical protein